MNYEFFLFQIQSKHAQLEFFMRTNRTEKCVDAASENFDFFAEKSVKNDRIRKD